MIKKADRFANKISLLVFCRFIIICVVSLALGYIGYSKSEVSQTPITDNFENISFSEYCSDELFKNSFHSSLFDMTVIAVSAISSLTFFCSAILYSVACFKCTVMGACISFLISNINADTKIKTVYIIYSILFILFLAFSQAVFLNSNRRFISEKHTLTSRKKPYFSKLLLKYFLWVALFLCVSYVIHVLMILIL